MKDDNVTLAMMDAAHGNVRAFAELAARLSEQWRAAHDGEEWQRLGASFTAEMLCAVEMVAEWYMAKLSRRLAAENMQEMQESMNEIAAECCQGAYEYAMTYEDAPGFFVYDGKRHAREQQRRIPKPRCSA